MLGGTLDDCWMSISTMQLHWTVLGLLPVLFIAILGPRVRQIWVNYVHLTKIPSPHKKDYFGFVTETTRAEFLNECARLLHKGFASGDAIRLHASWDHIVVLSPSYAERLRADEKFSPDTFSDKEMFGAVPGFEPYRFLCTHRDLVRNVISMRLNRCFVPATRYLSEAIDDGLRKQMGNDSDWREVPLGKAVLGVLTQSSFRALQGPELCYDDEWLEIATQYIVTSVTGVTALRKLPKLLVPVIHWFHPDAIKSRQLLSRARAKLLPVYEKRKKELSEASKNGTYRPEDADAFGWYEELADGRDYDPVVAQLTVAVAATHSTTDFMCQFLSDMVRYPEYIQPLRDELILALKEKGWKASTILQLPLLDSVMKESQRVKPVAIAFMRSIAQHDVYLQDAVKIPKNASVIVSAHSMRDATVYENPDSFDGYRFVNPTKHPESRHFTSVSVNHMGFGFGKHACPGRFFVNLETKILIAHLLLKYDWKFATDGCPAIRTSGFDQVVDPSAKMLVRRRKEEIRIEALYE
ncbi:cytochrome P450 [Corynespora cassiicola Philippines]|uniref:Cytochrome P450 n=1 Tax=Corynespora cassiicola Philippines TaxID=1448308 RepID=A0A2T2N2D6_CORCC|nr:cytochrome P450 [Corynespora cassiicola Philippines]